MAADMMDAITKSGVAPEQALGQYVRTLSLLTRPDSHPAVTRLLQSDAFTGSGEPDFQFRFGLDRILDGLAPLVAGRVVRLTEPPGGAVELTRPVRASPAWPRPPERRGGPPPRRRRGRRGCRRAG